MHHQLDHFQQAADYYRSYLVSGIESDPKRLLKAQTYRQQVLQEARNEADVKYHPVTLIGHLSCMGGNLSFLLKRIPRITPSDDLYTVPHLNIEDMPAQA